MAETELEGSANESNSATPAANRPAPTTPGAPPALKTAPGQTPSGKPADPAKADLNAKGGAKGDGKKSDGKPGDPNQPIDGEEEELGPKPSFWQDKWVQNAVPFATSLMVHIGIFILGVIAVAAARKYIIHDTSKEQTVIPDTALAQDNDLGGIPNPGPLDDNKAAHQENDPTVNVNKGWSQDKNEKLEDQLAGATGDTSSAISRGSGGAGSLRSGLGSGSTNSGGQSSFGPSGGGQGLGPQSKIFGHGSNIHSFVYVVDGSGSLSASGKDEVLRTELKKSVASLNPTQFFNVLVFQVTENNKGFIYMDTKLDKADAGSKANLYDFIDNKLAFHGGTNVIPSLDEAFREKPQLIYLLTDGLFEDTGAQAVIDHINQLNKDKKVKINAYLLMGSKKELDDQEMKDASKALQTIATGNGGVFRQFFADDLQ